MNYVYSLLPFIAAKHAVSLNQKRLGPSKLYDNYFMNKDGLWIYTTKWNPKGTPKGVIFIVHGMAEYCHRYDKYAALLVEEGFVVCAMDHQGHGRSEGDRLHVADFHDYVQDIIQHVNFQFDKDPSLKSLPRFIHGQSLGGLMSILLGLESKRADLSWSGFIIASPGLELDPKAANPVTLSLLGLLSWMVPKMQIPFEKGPIVLGPLSHDEVVCSHYASDPLVYHGYLRPRFSNEGIQALKEAQARSAEFSFPYLLLHGSKDPICPIAGSNKWHAGTSSKDKSFQTIEGAYHELLNEVPQYRDPTIKHIKDWLAAHLKPPAYSV